MVRYTVIILFYSLIFNVLTLSQLPQSNYSTNSGNRQQLHGEVPAAINNLGLQPINRLAKTKQLNLVIALPLRNQDALRQLISEIYDPSSPEYHHYLSPEEFNMQFGPTEQDYRTLIAFAAANHLKVDRSHNSRMLLEVSGAVADIENALHVRMSEYRRPESNSTFYAPDVDPSIDLAVPVQQIKGLTDYSYFHPNSVYTKLKSSTGANPNAGSAAGGLFIGDDFRNAYAPGVLLTGTGQTVGLLQFDGYNSSDIINYQLAAKRSGTVPLQNIYIGGFNGIPQDFNGLAEVTLDIDMAIAMAPGLSKVVVFEARNNSSYFDVILDSMAAHPEIKQLSTSWSSSIDYIDQTADQYFQRMAVQGQSFFCASGDHDAYIPSTVKINGKSQTSMPGFPESDTNITQVGGTMLGMHANGGSWASDIVWNTGLSLQDSLYWGSGGGISKTYKIPSWQKTLSTSNNNRSTTWRNIPDVALTADSIYVNIGSNIFIFSGTSCAAPLWAGFISLVNQQCIANGKQTVGFINPAIYSIGSGNRYTSDFHDVTSGNNIWPGSPGLFNAVPGYDLVTGWGTPNGQNLIDDLSGSPAGQISNGIVTPASGTTTTQFSFSVSYLSPTGQGPDSINVVIDNKSYKMTAQGSLWQNGVPFNYSYPALYSAGQHSYHFEGTVVGSVSIRYPAVGELQFTILNTTPSIVQQVSPLNNSLGNVQPVILKWISSAGANSYRVQLSTDSTFATTIADTTGLTDTTFNIQNLNSLTTYYWRVNATNLIGTSQWDKEWNFRTLGNPSLTSLIYPPANSVNIPLTVTFKWYKAQDQLLITKMKGVIKTLQGNSKPGTKNLTNISRYWFELTSDTSGNKYISNDSTLTDTLKQVAGLQNLTDYWWRIKAMNEAGWGDYTNWSKFTTVINIPDIVQQIIPINNSNGNIQPVVLKWNSSPRAGSYRLQVSTDSTFKTISDDNTGLTDTAFSINNLNSLATYYWRVNADNIGGESPWSYVWNFKTLGNPTQPMLIYPQANSVNILPDVIFRWNKSQDRLTIAKIIAHDLKQQNEINKVTTVSRYWFELKTDTTGTGFTINDSALFDTTKQVYGLDNSTKYWWRVSAMNEAGWGAFTNWFGFSTILPLPQSAPIPIYPGDNTNLPDTTSAILFSWKSAEFASKYDLQIASDINFNQAILDTNSTPDTVFLYQTKNLTTTFYWRVRGSNIAGIGPWSPVITVSLITGIDKLKNSIPATYELYQNYPNPFNPNTMIRFALPSQSNVKVEVYNILGERVKELLNEQKNAGYYEIDFNTAGLASGIYLYLIEAKSTDGKSGFRAVKKMILLK
jgi:hypothetical protein